MKTVIYLDELVLVNFVIAAAFLLGAGLLAGQRCSGPRLAAGAGAAGLSALLLLAPELPFGLALGVKAASGGACVALAYGWPGRRSFFHLAGWYLVLNLALTGGVLALPGGGAQTGNLVVYLDITPGRLLLCVAGVYLALRGILFCFGRPGAGCVPAVLELGGVSLPVRAFYDTGFSVEDPLSGRPVVLVRYEAVRTALPPALREELDAQLRTGGCPPPPDPALRLRFLLCRTIAGSKLLPTLPAERLTRQSKGRTYRQENLLAAFCAGSNEEGWSLLLGAETAGALGL